MGKRDEQTLFLAHPLYLDVPMMVSFLATLDNGVAYTSEVAERLGVAKEGEGEGGIKAGVPSLAQWLGLSLSADGRYRRRSTSDESVEAKLVREHTSASLFNILRQRLLLAGAVKDLRSSSDLDSVHPGDLVEVCGPVDVDPLRKVVQLISILAPFLGIDLGEDPKTTSQARSGSNRRSNSKNSSVEAVQSTDSWNEQAIRMLKLVIADLERSPLLDLILKSESGQNFVLAASADYMTDSAQQHLLAGQFVAIGKVTEVLSPNKRVSLLRRTVLSVTEASSEESADDMFSALAQSMPGLQLSELSVSGPGLQIVPLAIFV